MEFESLPSKSEQSRQIILHAAIELFIEQGYHGTSMRQIAKQANIALGGIYNHFANKEEIFRDALLERHPYREILPVFLEATGDTTESMLRDGASRLLKSMETRQDFIKLMFIEMVEFRSAHMNELFQRIFPQIVGIAQRIQQMEGTGLRDIPIPILVRSMIGTFIAFYFTEMLMANLPITPAEFNQNALDYFIDIYLHGILKRGAQ